MTDLLTRLFTTTSIQGIWIKILLEFGSSPMEPLHVRSVSRGVCEAMESSQFFEAALASWKTRFHGKRSVAVDMGVAGMPSTSSSSSSSSSSLRREVSGGAGDGAPPTIRKRKSRSLYDSPRKLYERYLSLAAGNAAETHAEMFELNLSKTFTFSKFRRLLAAAEPVWVDFPTATGSLLVEVLRSIKMNPKEHSTKLLPCVKLLVEEYGADASGARDEGGSPLAYAAARGADTVLAYLLPRVSKQRREGKVRISPAFRVREGLSLKGEFESVLGLLQHIQGRLEELSLVSSNKESSGEEMLGCYRRCGEVVRATVYM